MSDGMPESRGRTLSGISVRRAHAPLRDVCAYAVGVLNYPAGCEDVIPGG
jgi:hypothetical protein